MSHNPPYMPVFRGHETKKALSSFFSWCRGFGGILELSNTKKMDNELEKLTPKEVTILGEANKSIPKFCTSVNLSKLKNGDIVMQFLHSMDGKSDSSVLIESIIVDESHAKKISEILDQVINNKNEN